MEKQNNKICTGLLQNCMAAMQAEKKITKKPQATNENTIVTLDKNNQKPWSIFGEHYWI